MAFPYPTDRDIIRDLQDRYDEEPRCETCKYFRRCKELRRDGAETSWRCFHICDMLLHGPEAESGYCIVVDKGNYCEVWQERTDV